MIDARAAFCWAVTAVAFWAAWFASSALQLPLLWYLPLERRFVFGHAPDGIAMCVWGQLLLSSVVAAVCAGTAALIVRRREIPRPVVLLSAGWCALLLCFVVGYFAFALWGRVPMITLAPGLADGR